MKRHISSLDIHLNEGGLPEMSDRLPMRVLITGAAGKVARGIVPILREKYSLVLSDITKITDARDESIQVDLTKLDDVVAAFSGLDAIVHCAIAGYRTRENVPETDEERADYHRRMLDVNIKGTYNVFEAARILQIRRVTYLSSLTVSLGDEPEFKMAPDRPARPIDVYACTKLFGENLGRVYHEMHHLEVICLRLGQPYPLKLDREASWENDPRANRTFVTLGDLAHAVDSALSAGHVGFGIYNVVSLNENPIIETDSGKEIGFQPRQRWQDYRGT